MLHPYQNNGHTPTDICTYSLTIQYIQALQPRHPRRSRVKGKEKLLIIHLPNVAGISERIRNVCKDFNIRAMFNSSASFLIFPSLSLFIIMVVFPLSAGRMASSFQSLIAFKAFCCSFVTPSFWSFELPQTPSISRQ